MRVFTTAEKLGYGPLTDAGDSGRYSTKVRRPFAMNEDGFRNE